MVVGMFGIIIPKKIIVLLSFLLSLALVVSISAAGNGKTDLDYKEIYKLISEADRQLSQGEVEGESDDLFFVEEVIDGDTIVLEGGETVRYIGIDTPETSHPTKPIECFGEESKKINKNLVEGKMIRLEKDVSETDRYGRLLRYVWVDEIFVNDKLVRDGYASSVSYPPDVKYQEVFKQAQEEAMQDNRGLWNSCDL